MKAPAWLPYLFIAALLFGAAATYSASAENGKWEYMTIYPMQKARNEIVVMEMVANGQDREVGTALNGGLTKYQNQLGSQGWECFATSPIISPVVTIAGSTNGGGTAGYWLHFRRRID